MGAACLSICVRENRKSYQKTDRRTFKGRTPEARSCHTLRHRQPAHRRLTPLSHCFPAVERFKNPLRSNGLEQHKVQTQSRRVGNSSGHAVGAWGNLCKAGCLVYRQNTAHGQITGAQFHCSTNAFFAIKSCDYKRVPRSLAFGDLGYHQSQFTEHSDSLTNCYPSEHPAAPTAA
jgi:hypothetical protein